MTRFRMTYSRKLKLFLLCLMFLVLGGMAWIFLISRYQDGDKKINPLPFPKATLSIGKIQHTATRDGKTEWMLEAGSGQYLNDSKKIVLKDLVITYFLEDKGAALLKADEGVLSTETNDVQVSGNVVLENQGYRAKTRAANYNHENQIVSSDTPVTIENDFLRFTADRFKMNIPENKTYLMGNVKGFLGEK